MAGSLNTPIVFSETAAQGNCPVSHVSTAVLLHQPSTSQPSGPGARCLAFTCVGAAHITTWIPGLPSVVGWPWRAPYMDPHKRRWKSPALLSCSVDSQASVVFSFLAVLIMNCSVQGPHSRCRQQHWDLAVEVSQQGHESGQAASEF